MYDIVLLTDRCYINPHEENVYVKNVLKEDQLVLDALQAEGLSAVRKSWDDPDYDWSSTKYALFRAVWDYFDRIEEFTHWFESTAPKTNFINSKALILWNIDKHYLIDLEKKGVHIPTTLFIEAKEETSLQEAIAHLKNLGVTSDDFVLKPCIAGGARHTYKFNGSECERYEAIFRELIAKEAMMLQEFQKHIVSEGELSLMVCNGQYTHAIIKNAKPGDFRVQDDWGGTVKEYHPTPEEITFAENAMKSAPELPIYGRADIFRDNSGQLALAELEIFEPELWFRFFPDAAEKLAKAIKETYFQ